MAQVKNSKDKLITVKIGDVVGFKNDYEQYGVITKISRNMMGREQLHLHSDNGFGGEYLQGATDTVELASDCWID